MSDSKKFQDSVGVAPPQGPKIDPAKVEVLLDASTVQARVRELGKAISLRHHGHNLTLVGILKGCFVFLADLVRAIDVPMRCEFIGISSYGNETESTGVVKLTSDLVHPIEHEHVVLVEDIVDTGLTMRYLVENFATRHPASLEICTLLHKPARSRVEVKLDYVGFTIPDHFVVGYGLDYMQYLRNLPFVGIYRG
jgi:hypoxanthine phosphoribosyltransferase